VSRKREESPLPPGLAASGSALWRDTLAEFELSGPELALLGEACRVADRLAEIAAELGSAELTVAGSTGQPRPHPLLAEARSQARLLDQLVRALALPGPGEQVGQRRSPSAREAANVRWMREKGNRHGAT
jgi:hypothetical protein